jgi:hypothetical protein
MIVRIIGQQVLVASDGHQALIGAQKSEGRCVPWQGSAQTEGGGELKGV